MVAELRNDSSEEIDLGRAVIRFYDAGGEVVCTRSALPFSDILSPGEITAFHETTPSSVYRGFETNEFPEDWIEYEITLPEQRYYTPSEFSPHPIGVTVQEPSVETDSGGDLLVVGDVLNETDEAMDDVVPYAILYSAGGDIVNANRCYGVGELEPEESESFEICFDAQEPIEHATYVVAAYAHSGD